MPLKRKSIKKKSGNRHVPKLSLSKRNRNSKNKRSLRINNHRQHGGDEGFTRNNNNNEINCNSDVSLQFKNSLKFIHTRVENKLGGYYVTLSNISNRDRNSGTWKIIKVEPSTKMLRRECLKNENKKNRINSCLQYGDRVELINMYNQYNGYLHNSNFNFKNQKIHGLITLQHPFYNRDNDNGWQLAKVDNNELVYSGKVKSNDKICLVCVIGGKKYVVVKSQDKKIFDGLPVLQTKEIPDSGDIETNGILTINKIDKHHHNNEPPPPYRR